MTFAAGRRVALEISEPLLAARLTQALDEAGAQIVEREPGSCGFETLLIGSELPDNASEAEIAEATWLPVAAIRETPQDDSGPQHVLIALPSRDEIGDQMVIATLTTLIGYITTHTHQQRLSINGLVYPRTARGADYATGVSLAVAAGLLDEMRGQVLHVGGD